jgi:hypothetical protein
MKTLVTLGVILASVSGAWAQDITRVLPNGLTIIRDPGTSITVERQGKHRSFSISVGRNAGDPSATATANASSVSTNGAPAVAYARAATSARVTPNGVDIARARAVAIGQTTSTSAVTKP